MNSIHARTAAITIGLAAVLVIPARATLLDFETFPDGSTIPDSTVITTEFSSKGVVFIDGTMDRKAGTVLTAGVSLNEFDFPPASPDNVLAEYEGLGLRGEFTSPVTSVGARFTYAWPISLLALGASGQTLGQVDSLFDQNYVSSGNPPNEPLSITGVGDIYAFEVIFRTAAGAPPSDAAFALDDLQFTPPTGLPDSLPSWTGAAMMAGLLLVVRSRRSSLRG